MYSSHIARKESFLIIRNERAKYSRDSRRDQIDFHVKEGDYFATAATVLNLISEKLEHRGILLIEAEMLKEIREDLIFLQNNYEIVEKYSGNKAKS